VEKLAVLSPHFFGRLQYPEILVPLRHYFWKQMSFGAKSGIMVGISFQYRFLGQKLLEMVRL
jgi:hypothetical protein